MTDSLETVFSAYDRAAHSADPSAALALAHPDATVEVMGQPARSMREHVEFLRMFASAFADQATRHTDRTIEGDTVATRWTFEGTHVGPFMGVPATGKRVAFSGLGLITIRDGKIARVVGEADLGALLRAIGAMPPA